MKTTELFYAMILAAAPLKACTIVDNIKFTFFGYPDNSPPGPSTAYNCGGRNNVAGGSGSYSDPLTCAAASGDYSRCEIVYIPFLKKYCRIEDVCGQCGIDKKNGIKHIDIWTGSSTQNGGQDQIDCENSLTPDSKYQIIRQPGSDYGGDTSPLYSNGDCHTERVYPSNGNKGSSYCASKTIAVSTTSTMTSATSWTSVSSWITSSSTSWSSGWTTSGSTAQSALTSKLNSTSTSVSAGPSMTVGA